MSPQCCETMLKGDPGVNVSVGASLGREPLSPKAESQKVDPLDKWEFIGVKLQGLNITVSVSVLGGGGILPKSGNSC